MYIGIDIGGTNMRLASTLSVDKIEIMRRLSLPNLMDYEANEEHLIEAIGGLSGREALAGIGIGIPGLLNDAKTTVDSANYISQWKGHPIAEVLAKRFHCPVIMDHDAQNAALGEALYGAAPPAEFTYIAYGTGIGCATVTYLNGRPRSAKISNENHSKYCSPWQAECGGRGIEATLGKAAATLSEAEWDVIMGKFYDYLVFFIEGQKPVKLIFGGGVAMKQWPRLQAVFKRLKAEHPELQDLQITAATFGEDVGLYGSFALLKDNLDPSSKNI